MRLRIDGQEDVRIGGIELSPRGSGNDRNSVLEVIVAEDRDNNGKYEDGRDRVWGIGTYEHDNRKSVVEINVVLEKKDSVNLVIAYLMGKGLKNSQKFEVSLTDIKATGLVSEGEVRFTGLPIASIEMKTQGNGDAIEVRQGDNLPADVSSNTSSGSNKTPPASSNVSGASEGGLFGNLFASKSDVEKNEDSPWVPSPGLRTTLFVILGFVGLVVIWKIFYGLFKLLFTSVD